MSDDNKYKYLDIDQINEDIESGKVKVSDDDPVEVLYGTILDIVQLAADEGFTDEEIDDVLRRIMDFRAEQHRKRFTLHTTD